ncbi:MAG: Na/Pi symporter [Spirochaetes bacterium]|nr:Na/Pi symporter [Spirochaetota bacterium]
MKKNSLIIFSLLFFYTLGFGQDRKIQLINRSYPEGSSYINSIAGKEVGGIKVEVLKNNIPQKNIRILFRSVVTGSGTAISFKKNIVLSDDNGIAQTTLNPLSKKGDYVVSASLPDDPNIDPVYINIKAYASSWMIMVFIGLLGGLGMFLFGMKLGADNLQNMAGNKMKGILSRFTTNPVSGLVVGITATAAVQSSSASSAMVVGFVSATLMTLKQAFSVLLGARIGTTITAQLIAFKLSDYSLLLVILGFILLVSAKKKRIQFLGNILIGFGFIFFGMGVMSTALGPLRSYPPFLSILLSLSDNPFLALLFSAIFTGIIQSSGATVGLCIIFAEQGLLTLHTIIPIALGAMIGTCMTGILASLGANKDGKRVALANLIFAVLGAAICFPLVKYISIITFKVTSLFGTTSLPRQVANSYTISTIIASVGFLPFLGLFSKLMMKIMPADKKSAAFTPKYLQDGFENSPDLALDLSTKEILRMGRITEDMLKKVPEAFEKKIEDLIRDIIKMDDNVDILDEAIRPYLNKTARGNLTAKQSSKYMAQLYFTSYIENSGDIVVKNLMHLANKLIDENFSFDESQIVQLKDFNSKVNDLFNRVLDAFEKNDIEKAEQVTQLYNKLNNMGKKIQQEHFTSLQADSNRSIAESSVFLDTISGLMSIGSLINSMAITIIENL